MRLWRNNSMSVTHSARAKCWLKANRAHLLNFWDAISDFESRNQNDSESYARKEARYNAYFNLFDRFMDTA